MVFVLEFTVGLDDVGMVDLGLQLELLFELLSHAISLYIRLK